MRAAYASVILAVLSICYAFLPLTARADDAEVCSRSYNGGDYATAFPACQRIAQTNAEPTIAFALGRMYQEGRGTGKDPKEALKWYQRAAERGLVAAQYNLAGMYKKGEGAAANDALAIQWYETAALHGDADAQTALGILFGNGNPESARKPDPAKALAWDLKAAAQGNALAQHNAAYYYLYGVGVPQDVPRAVSLMTQSAEGGNVSSARDLGIHYLHGWKLPKDPAKGAVWLKRSAEGGDVEAQINYAMLLSMGLGVAKDPKASFMWFQKAADPYVKILSRPGEVTKEECPVRCKTAVRYLARAYASGLNGATDHAKAERLFALANGEKLPPDAAKDLVNTRVDVRTLQPWLDNRYWRQSALVEPDLATWTDEGKKPLRLLSKSTVRLQPQSDVTYDYEFDLTVIMISENVGDAQRLPADLQLAADLFAKCGVRLRSASISVAAADPREIEFEGRHSVPSPHAIVWYLPDVKDDGEKVGGLAVITARGQLDQPHVYVRSLNEEGRVPGDIAEALRHELGHLLGEMGHPDDLDPNQMQYFALAATRFNPGQCERIRKWPWLYRSVNKLPEDPYPRLGMAEAGALMSSIDSALSKSNPDWANAKQPLRRLLMSQLGAGTQSSPLEDYAFSRLVEQAYADAQSTSATVRDQATREGMYLEMLSARRHGFVPDSAFLSSKDYRPKSLDVAQAEKLRQWYMESRPEVVLTDPSFWTAPQNRSPSMPVAMATHATTRTSTPGSALVNIARTGDGAAGLNGIGVVSDRYGKWLGTGFLVSECHVLTSKHNMFVAPVFARPLRQVQFAAGEPANAGGAFQKPRVEGRVIAYGNYAGINWTANGDWALIQLAEPIGKDVGFVPIYQMKPEMLKGRNLLLAGYPDAASTDKTTGALPLRGIQSCSAEGVRLINMNIVQTCQTAPGLSGGPVLTRAPNGKLYAIGLVTTSPWGGAMEEAPNRTSVNFESGKAMGMETDGDEIAAAIDAHSCH